MLKERKWAVNGANALRGIMLGRTQVIIVIHKPGEKNKTKENVLKL